METDESAYDETREMLNCTRFSTMITKDLKVQAESWGKYLIQSVVLSVR